MEVVTTAQQRRDAGIPEWNGFYHDPYCLPGRHDGEHILDFISRSSADVRQYCRALVEWGRRNPNLAPEGVHRLIRAIETRTRK